ncbi:toxin co-regulated pilus biosynthesis Q family protein [Castellaniella sp. UC4442_H9]
MHVVVCRVAIACAALVLCIPSMAATTGPRPSIRVKIINPGEEQPSTPAAPTAAAPASVAGTTAKPGTTQAPVAAAQEVKTAPVAAVEADDGTKPTKEIAASASKPAAPAKPAWNAETGSTLRATVEAWAAKAGWTVRWEADDLNYPIDVGFSMEGAFTDIVSATFDLYKAARRSFKVWLYEPQHLVVVQEKK